MKKITLTKKVLISFIFLILISTGSYAQHCSIEGTNGYNIEGVVTTGGTTNINLANATVGTLNYTDVDQTLTIAQNGTFNVSITQENTWSRVLIWVDWNGDDDFADTGEYVGPIGLNNASNSLDLATDIVVPSGTTVGTKKMRIISGDAWTWDDNDVDDDGVLIPDTPCAEFVNSAIKDFKISVTSSATASVSDFEKQIGFQLLPNPIQGDFVTLKMNVQNKKVTTQLYSITGKLIQKNSFNSFDNSQKINLANVSSGIYLFSVIMDDNKITRKIVKE